MDLVRDKNIELFFDMDAFFDADKQEQSNQIDINLRTVERIVQWDKKNKRLDAYKYQFLVDILERRKSLTDRNKFLVSLNLKTVEKFGFINNDSSES